MIRNTAAWSLKSSHICDLNLLEQRNATLSLENEQLLQRIEDLQSRLQQYSEEQESLHKHFLAMQTQRRDIFKLLNTKISNLAQCSQQIVKIGSSRGHKKQSQDPAHQDHQQIIMLAQMNQSSTDQQKSLVWTINQIFQPIESIFKNYHDQQQSQNGLSRISEALNRRKNQHHKRYAEKEVIHVVREPAASSVEDLIQRENQVEYTIMCYQKLLRRIAQTVALPNCHEIGIELRSICRIRKSASEIEAMLRDCERQIELGIKSSLLVEDLSHKLLQLRGQDHEARKKIDMMIAAV